MDQRDPTVEVAHQNNLEEILSKLQKKDQNCSSLKSKERLKVDECRFPSYSSGLQRI